MRESPLGVQRAVDRIDDDAHARVAVVHLTALLGDRDEAPARPMEPVELGKHEVLGRRVDEECSVAALTAAAGLLGALARGRARDEHRA